MKSSLADQVTRISGIDVASDRYISVNGPPITQMPEWGLTLRTTDMEYHLHPAIHYEINYCVPKFILVHTYNGAQGRLAEGQNVLSTWIGESGESCIIPPNHTVRIIQDTPLEFLAVDIEPHRLTAAAKRLNVSVPDFDGIFKTLDPAFTALTVEIRRTLISDPYGTGPYLDGLIDSLLARFLSAIADPYVMPDSTPESLTPFMARKVTTYVEEQISDPIRVETLAALLGVSSSHFSRSFAASFGMSPQKYIISRRIARART